MQRKVSTLEHRLTVLYALEALGNVSNVQLLTFMVELDLMNYIDLELALHDLKQAGYIEGTVHPIGLLYEATSAGREALQMFLKRLPISKQAAMEMNRKAYRSRFLKEKTIIGDYRGLENGKCQLELKIGQGNDWLMILLLILPQGKQAHTLIQAFNQKAEDVYAWLFAELSTGYVPNHETGDIAMVEFVWGAFPEDEFSLTLALPQGDLPKHFKTVFQKESTRLKDGLLRLLSE